MKEVITAKDLTDIMKILGLSVDDFVIAIHLYPHRVEVVTERVIYFEGFAQVAKETTEIKVNL